MTEIDAGSRGQPHPGERRTCTVQQVIIFPFCNAASDGFHSFCRHLTVVHHFGAQCSVTWYWELTLMHTPSLPRKKLNSEKYLYNLTNFF